MSPARSIIKPSRSRQRGVTLIEALIAGVILAIGVLGIVSLLTLSKVSQHEAMQRTRAIAMADDILERIRRNPAGILTYRTGATGLENPLGNGSIALEPAPNCTSAPCTPVQLAAHDRWAWESLLDGAAVTAGGNSAVSIPGLRGCIGFTADAGKTNTGVVRVTLQWQGLRDTIDAVPSGGAVCGGVAANTDRTRRQVIIDSYLIDETEI
jgi:type IV pilus assembly protein PilV